LLFPPPPHLTIVFCIIYIPVRRLNGLKVKVQRGIKILNSKKVKGRKRVQEGK